MPRKKKTKKKISNPRVPRTRCGETWTEAAFWGFIRSNIRLMSRKWGPIREVLKDARRPYAGPDKRRKWEFQCARCRGWFARKEVEVNHLIPCGSLKSFEDIGPFVKRLLVEKEGFEVLCKGKGSCHQKETNSQKVLAREKE